MTTLRRAFNRAVQKAQYAGWRPGLTGKVVSGSYIVSVPNRAQTIYVRIFQGGNTTVEEVLNLRVANKENIPVWIGRAPGGETVIMDVRQEEAVNWAGSGAPGLAVGPHTHEIGFGLDDPVGGRRISPLLIYCTTPASLSVNINAGFYEYSGDLKYYAGGTFDLTSYVPSTSGKWAWVLVHLNPETGVISATKGTEYNRVQPLTENLITDIALSGTVPLAAVKLAAAQESICNESTFADCRVWPTGIGGSASSMILHHFAATAAPTANDDSADGYSVGSWWLDTSADKAYICLDAAVGAAVWHQADSGGVTDHGTLTGLADDDHTQYLLASGARALSGDLNANGSDLNNVATLLLNEGDEPGTPAANKMVLYAKADGKPYAKDDAGNEYGLAASGGTVDAADVTYTPAVDADWDGGVDPGNADDALDQLAERVTDVEGGGTVPTFAGAHAVRTAAQTISSTTWTALSMTAADAFDTNDYHDPVTNPTRITVPAGKAGYYSVWCRVWWDTGTGAAKVRYLGFKKNGAGDTFWYAVQIQATAYALCQVTSGIIHLAAGDYIEMMVYHDTGTTLGITQGNFAIALLGT